MRPLLLVAGFAATVLLVLGVTLVLRSRDGAGESLPRRSGPSRPPSAREERTPARAGTAGPERVGHGEEGIPVEPAGEPPAEKRAAPVSPGPESYDHDPRRRAASIAEEARETGPAAEHALKWTAWLTRLRAVQEKLRPAADAAEQGDRAAAVAYNEEVDATLRQLVADFGDPAAREYARRMRLHKVDPDTGLVYRVDHRGERMD